MIVRHMVSGFLKRTSIVPTSGYEDNGGSSYTKPNRGPMRGSWTLGALFERFLHTSKSSCIGGSISVKRRQGQKLSLNNAGMFAELAPNVVCIIDRSGNILYANQKFRKKIQNIATGKKTNIAELFLVEKRESFVNLLEKLFEDTFEISHDFMTTTLESVELYKWTLTTNEDIDYIMMTGTLLSERSLPYNANRSEISDLSRKNESRIRPYMSEMSAPNNQHGTMDLEEATFKIQSMEESLESKRTMVRYMSHELRTPLSVVLTGLDLIKSFFQPSDTGASDAIDIIQDVRSACVIAVDILNDLITFEKLETNILTLETGPCDVVEIISAEMKLFQIAAQQKNVELRLINKIMDGSAIVNADSTKLSQVFRNLLSNALKFTRSLGQVTTVISLNKQNNHVRIEVHDTGAGMSKENRKRLFREVIQFNAKELQNGGGSGLGLYLARRIIDMHHGLIGVDTEWEGLGSRFYVELPLLSH